MAIDTTLRQWCPDCAEATITTHCRRSDGDQCCSRHCCPPGYDVDREDW